MKKVMQADNKKYKKAINFVAYYFAISYIYTHILNI